MRILLSGLLSVVAMFTAGGLWNAVLMTGFYASRAPGIARPPEAQSFLFLILGYVVLGAFMTFLFSQSFRSRPSVVEGFQFGALFGLIATLPLYLILHAIWDFQLSWALVDSAWHLFEEGLGGITLALTMFPKAAAAPAAESKGRAGK